MLSKDDIVMVLGELADELETLDRPGLAVRVASPRYLSP